MVIPARTHAVYVHTRCVRDDDDDVCVFRNLLPLQGACVRFRGGFCNTRRAECVVALAPARVCAAGGKKKKKKSRGFPRGARVESKSCRYVCSNDKPTPFCQYIVIWSVCKQFFSVFTQQRLSEYFWTDDSYRAFTWLITWSRSAVWQSNKHWAMSCARWTHLNENYNVSSPERWSRWRQINWLTQKSRWNEIKGLDATADWSHGNTWVLSAFALIIDEKHLVYWSLIWILGLLALWECSSILTQLLLTWVVVTFINMQLKDVSFFYFARIAYNFRFDMHISIIIQYYISTLIAVKGMSLEFVMYQNLGIVVY